MSTLRVWALGINPEPWAIGDATAIAPKGQKAFVKISPNKTLKAYQEALAEELLAAGAEVEEGNYSFRLTFSRQLEKYTTRTRTVTRNRADGSNLQKATEDALQGVAIGNDRAVARGVWQFDSSQRPSTMPYVIIELMSQCPEDHGPSLVIPGNWLTPEAVAAKTELFEKILRGGDVLDNEWDG